MKILIGLVLVVGIFLVFVATRPSEMVITRELLMKATPESIFPYLNNNKKADEWMPWAEVDPNVKTTYEGPAEGLGSKSSWVSSGKMGVGEALIVESLPNKAVKTQLTYSKPMEMSQLAEISLQSTAEGTVVRWTVTGHNSFLGRLFCVFGDMDKIVGGQFERGLVKLKGLVEKK